MTLVGTTVGRIRVVEALGKGGMGEVYAGYDEKLKRKVALKAIRDERRLDDEAKARFLREARILSQLDHPAICRIYELIEGDDADLLVLELIPGKSLKQAMEEDELDPAFQQHVAERVTEALVAAHAQGIAHRDLKPENVMLTPEGGVKVLDFGLAYNPHSSDGLTTALDGDGDEVGDMPGGPDCGPADDSSATVVPDMTQPSGTAGPPWTATLRWSGTQRSDAPDPTRSGAPGPGAELAGDTGSAMASDFVETQRGIVMGTVAYMAPEQARGERVTVAGDLYSLGLMLQELFTGQSPYEQGLALLEMLRKAATAKTRPVTGVDPDLGELIERLKSLDPADRPSAVETAQRLKWIRGKPGRRQLKRLAAAILAVLLLGGFKYTVDTRRERNKAQAALRETREVLDFVVGLFATSDPKLARGAEVTARDMLDAGATRIAGELRDQPRSRFRLMLTMGRIYRQLGFYEQARLLLEEGLQIRSELGDDDLETAESLDQLASLYTDQGDFDRAEPLFRRSLEIRERELGAGHPYVAASLNNLAFHFIERGDSAPAESLLRRALEIQEAARGAEHPDVAGSLINLAELYRDRGELGRAEPYLRRALEVQEKVLAPNHPDLAYSLNSLAMMYYAQGETARAEPLFRRTLEIQEQVLGAVHPNVAVSLNNLAELYRSTGDYQRAESLYRRALEIQERALGAAHPDVAVTCSNLADLYFARGEHSAAEPLYARALEVQEAALGAAHPSVGVTLNHQADLYLARGEPARAEPLYRRALELQEQAYGGDHLSVAITLADLGDLYLSQGRPAEAERLFLRSQAATRQALSEDGSSRRGRHLLAAVRLGLGRVYQASGAADRATSSWTRAAAIMEPLAAGSEAVALLDTQARALLHLGRVEEARPIATGLLAKGWRGPELLELCRQHGCRPQTEATGAP